MQSLDRTAFSRAPGGLSRRASLAAITGVWLAALLLAGVGMHARYGEWPGAAEWLLVTPLLTLFALPAALLDSLGLPFDGGTAILMGTGLAFWSVMAVLHAAALFTGRRVYVALIAAVLAPAAWNWTVLAVGLMGV